VADLDAAARGVTAERLLPGARGALIAGSGGPAFFGFFSASPEARDGAADPLDRYTRRIVEHSVGDVLAPLGVRRAVHFPFGTNPVVPFQRLGRAAGLGAPGPLGLHIHPTYGAWWAYRALVVVDRELPIRPPPGDGCAGCEAPCVAACPGIAVARAGFVVAACHAHRLIAPPCQLSCVARIACVRGPEHRYTDAELAFHMAASMPRRATAT
jgi:epoxyqueuosine reductase